MSTNGSVSQAIIAAVRLTPLEQRKARGRLQRKAVFITGAILVNYYLLVIATLPIYGRIFFGGNFTLLAVSVGTSIMHDANHSAMSRSRRLNRIIGYSVDLMGGSSWFWQPPFARLAPQQPWHWWHRYQHIYMWFLYGFLILKWTLVADFQNLIRGRIGPSALEKRPKPRELALLFGGKMAHVSWALVIPMFFRPWWGVLAFYVVCSWTAGFLLAMIFQLAHCVDSAEFMTAEDATKDIVLQTMRTTVNIRCRVPVLRSVVRFMMGGLDHQIEHHIAPRIPHTAYPEVGRRLKAYCLEHAIRYREHISITAAIVSHARWLRQMGKRPILV